MKRCGAALVTSLGIVVILAILSSSFLLRAIHETLLSRRSSSQHHALFLAEASMDTAIQNLRVGQSNDVSVTTMSGGSFWAEVDPTLVPMEYLITGHGFHAGEQRNTEAVVRQAPTSVFQFALFGSQQVVVSGEAITDSYNSSQGPYDPNAFGQNGDVGTNATTAGGVNISGSIAINGQIAVGANVADPNSVVTITGGSAIITENPPVVSQSQALPTPPVTVPGGLTCTDLTVTGQTVVTLSSAVGQYCFEDLSISGGGTLTADGSVKVYVTGQFSASGNTTIGVSSDPTYLLLLLVSSQEATIEGGLTGNTEFYGGLYAPTATINISGNAEVFGSVVAKTVKVSGNAKVHYDEALGVLTDPVGLYQVRVFSWRELD